MTETAAEYGISAAYHTVTNDGHIIITEREALQCPGLEGTLEERAETTKGTVLANAKEMRHYINKAGFTVNL